MTLSAISSLASQVLPTVNFHPRGHRKGAAANGASSTSSTSSTSGSSIGIGQLPVGASTPLFSSILQSLQQTVGVQAAATASSSVTAATASAGATAASATSAATAGGTLTGATGTAANVQAFMHSLFQALKQDGLGSAATPAAGSSASSGTASGSYDGNAVSSLQTLIQQVSAGGTGGAATANLTTAYQNLVNGIGGTAAASGAATTGSSTGLQHFLGNLLVNLQSGGVSSLSGVGNNVNANV